MARYPKVSAEFSELSSVSICISGSVAHSAVFTRTIHGTIGAVTEKAIRVDLKDRKGSDSIWFPKKAVLSHQGMYDVIHSLAIWFTPDARQWRTIERFENIGGVSAA